MLSFLHFLPTDYNSPTNTHLYNTHTHKTHIHEMSTQFGTEKNKKNDKFKIFMIMKYNYYI